MTVRRLALLAGLTLGACGSSEPAAVPPACEGSPATILSALRTAPGGVRLRDDTRLSTCIERARDDGAIQQIGLAFTPAAQALADRHSADAALRLGFLVGAAHRGGRTTNNVHAQLLRKLDGIAATLGGPALVSALERGIAAGEDHG